MNIIFSNKEALNLPVRHGTQSNSVESDSSKIVRGIDDMFWSETNTKSEQGCSDHCDLTHVPFPLKMTVRPTKLRMEEHTNFKKNLVTDITHIFQHISNRQSAECRH